MCPACIATAAWIAAGAGSAGGITAFVFGRRNPRKDASKNDSARSRGNSATNAQRTSQSSADA